MLVFILVIENNGLLSPSFFALFSHALVALLTIQRSRREEEKKNNNNKKKFIMPGHFLALINRARGLHGRILTDVVSTDQTQ